MLKLKLLFHIKKRIKLKIPKEIIFKLLRNNKLLFRSFFPFLLYYYAILIKKFRWPKSYKKKGIYFLNEVQNLKLKEGKKKRW